MEPALSSTGVRLQIEQFTAGNVSWDESIQGSMIIIKTRFSQIFDLKKILK